MTDTAYAGAHDWESPAARARIKRRHRKDRRLRHLGASAIGIALALLLVLVVSLGYSGYVAFYTTKVSISVPLDAEKIDPANPAKADYRGITRDAIYALFPDVTNRKERRSLTKLFSSGAPFIIRDYVVDHPEEVGQTIRIWVPLSDPFDQMHKGIVPRQIDALSGPNTRRFTELDERGLVGIVDDRTVIELPVTFDREAFGGESVSTKKIRAALLDGLGALMPDQRSGALRNMLAQDAAKIVRQRLLDDRSLIGQTVRMQIPLAESYDALKKTGEAKILNPRFESTTAFDWFDSLKDRDLLSSPFSWELFVNSDSRFPELAGLAGALSGSFLALLICFVISFPIGISAAIYLEEFAPKNRFTDAIEVNINNLAAVPSVVFGLLGLAVFINFMGLPRSAPIVGGLVLALMTLPTIIVATRSALKAVPPSIREAALGIGASKHEMILHHVIPLAMPGILTGTIIGLAQALGETAPLLLVGMNAFIPSIDNIGLFQPATSLPTQIFAWGDSPERGFVSRTSAAILVLLGFLITMNIIAIYLRQKFERKW